ncbi:MAG TPA: phage portal protein, partial [Anaerolineae bacterium]|nr:phage portal protein [Anaerolineae bacterium]
MGQRNGSAAPEPQKREGSWKSVERFDNPLANCIRRENRVVTRRTEKGFNTPGFLESLVDTSFGVNREDIRAPYRESVWVHAAIKLFGAAVRSVPLRFYSSNPSVDRNSTPLPDSDPLVKLFRTPERMVSSSDFFEAGLHHRKLTGEDFWVLHKGGRVMQPGADGLFELPDEIQAISGANVQHFEDTKGIVRLWRFRANTTTPVEIDARFGVVQFRDYDIHNPNRGVGDVEVLMRTLQQEFTAHRYTEALLENSGDPGGWIKVKETLSPETQREVEAEIDDDYSTENRGRWRVMAGEDIDFVPNRIGPKDMEFQELFKSVREQAAACIGVPLPVMSVLDKATWNNYAQAHFAFWTGGNGVIPYLTTVQDAIETKFLARLSDRRYQTVFARFDLSGVDALTQVVVDKAHAAGDLMQKVKGMTWPKASTIMGLDDEGESEKGGLDVALVSSTDIPYEAAIGREKVPDRFQQPPPSAPPVG